MGRVGSVTQAAARSGGRRLRRWARVAALMSVLAMLAASCRSDEPEGASSTTVQGDAETDTEVATDIGVSDTEITLGSLTDLTGPFAAQGKSSTQGLQLAFDQINEDGGICGRTLTLRTEDFAFNVQQGVTAYQRLVPEVVAFVHTLSAPLVLQLAPSLAQDHVLMLGSPLAAHLQFPEVVVLTTLFSLDMINGLVQFAEDEGLAPGDKIGFVYFEGPVGDEVNRSMQYAADDLGLELFSQQVKVTDTDLTAQLTAARDEGADVLVVATAPGQLASLLSVATGTGFDVPVLSAIYSFDPSLLNTPARDALLSRVDIVGSYSPYSNPAPGPSEVRELFEAEYPNEPRSFGVMYAYAQALTFAQILEAACEAGDMTRAGLQEAMTTLSGVDTEGLVPVLDFSSPGQPPSRESYMAVPDGEIDGGLQITEELFVTPQAEAYDVN